MRPTPPSATPRVQTAITAIIMSKNWKHFNQSNPLLTFSFTVHVKQDLDFALDVTQEKIAACSLLLLNHNTFRSVVVKGHKRTKSEQLIMDAGGERNVVEAARDDSEELDLNLGHRFLDSLPNDIHVLNNVPDVLKITRLNLAGNIISVLPDSIGNFVNLKEIDISGNGLAYITPRVGELRQLKTFIARNNNLDELPKEFAQLLALENLNLSGNRFESFMPQLFELVSLRTLYFGGNRIDVIPPDIQNLQR